MKEYRSIDEIPDPHVQSLARAALKQFGGGGQMPNPDETPKPPNVREISEGATIEKVREDLNGWVVFVLSNGYLLNAQHPFVIVHPRDDG